MADSASESDSILQRADCSAIGTVISTLPTQRGWTTSEVKLYQGFWHMDYVVPGILSLQESFRGNPDHIVLTTYPKSGTTWLKAFLVSIMNRSSCNFTGGQGQTGTGNPLVSSNPHGFVPIMEFHAASNFADPNAGDGQRLLGTHLPYSLLPKSMIESGCKIVHVMREPKDVFVSLWHFACELRKGDGLPPLALDDVFDRFCDGFSECGPYWDYEIEYWNASSHQRFLFPF
uniref:Sulfotransferase n=1 Tax=Kalanchoe fedtschenkoi TaxID=63787 RepID=A0A7N0TE13_KALFE